MSLSNNDLTQDRSISVAPDGDRTAAADYRELFEIGRGGFATISVALAQGIEGFSKLVVLKALREELSLQPGAIKMFLDEARILARMNHPNIVQVYEVFRRRKMTVIVMEYVDGQPLTNLLNQCRDRDAGLSIELGLYTVIRVLAALHYVHTLNDFNGEPLGLIHRDVSPHNVMVTYDGQVKLLDFGIAKLANPHPWNVEQTMTGIVKGKITYMAPEQFAGPFDHRADIFAVGVMLWELATRRRYWAGVSDAMIMTRLVSGELPHLTDRGDMDDDLARICDKAMSLDVRQRYPSAAAMQEDIERYLNARGIVVSQASLGQCVSEQCAEARKNVQSAIRAHVSEMGLTVTGIPNIPPGDSSWPTKTELDPGPRQSRFKAILAAVLVAAALVLVVVVAFFGHTRPAPAAATGAPQPSNDAVPGKVRLHAHAQPVGAVWYLDDVRLGPDPLDIRIPKDDAAHLLRADADGYMPFLRAIRVESDLDVTAALSPQPVDSAQPVSSSPGSGSGSGKTSVSRSVTNRTGGVPLTPAPGPAEPSPQHPPVTGGTNGRSSSSPPQFGDSLKRPGPRADYGRRAIDTDYPSSRR